LAWRPVAVKVSQQMGQVFEVALLLGDVRVHRLAQLVRSGLMGADPVRRAVDADDGSAVQESVEHRGGDGGVTESCCPVSDPDIRSEDRAGLEVALVDDLEQRGSAVAG
jgi:hypothetical protein